MKCRTGCGVSISLAGFHCSFQSSTNSSFSVNVFGGIVPLLGRDFCFFCETSSAGWVHILAEYSINCKLLRFFFPLQNAHAMFLLSFRLLWWVKFPETS